MKSKSRIVVSDIQIVPFRPKDGHLGFASCIINDQFYLADVAIFSRPQGGIRLGYPIKTLSNGIALNIFKPLNKEAEAAIEQAILEKYESLMETNGSAKEQRNDRPQQT